MSYSRTLDALSDTLAEAVEMAKHAEADTNTDQPRFAEILHTLYALSQTIQDAERQTVELARQTGGSWSDIARAYGGMSKQGAQQRWG